MYTSVEFEDGKPKPGGWKTGKQAQRVHDVREDDGGIYVRLSGGSPYRASDAFAKSMRAPRLHLHYEPVAAVEMAESIAEPIEQKET
jgi:hypothetical protein